MGDADRIEIPRTCYRNRETSTVDGLSHRRRPRSASSRDALSSARAKVALVPYRRDLKEVADELPGPSARVRGDVRDADFNEAVADGVVAEWGGVDVWICNAGISPIVAGPLDIEPEVWRDVIDVNLTGAFLGARAAARVMGRAGG